MELWAITPFACIPDHLIASSVPKPGVADRDLACVLGCRPGLDELVDKLFVILNMNPQAYTSFVSSRCILVALYENSHRSGSSSEPNTDKPCPHCRETITDLLSEMVPDSDQTTADYLAIVGRKPGGAITCPFCQLAVEHQANGP
jgi:hypothetical protein